MLSFYIFPCEQQTVEKREASKKWHINVKFSVNIIKMVLGMYF